MAKRFDITKNCRTFVSPNKTLTTMTTKNVIQTNEVVDLGLPSGTLWAKCNLGAERETDFGLFYSWGDTKGYNTDEVHRFSWDTYKYGTSWDGVTKYNKSDGKVVLDNEDDPVYVATDGKMVSPTKEQFKELIGYTNHEWTEIDGIKGMKFINKNDDTKYIFIPAAGSRFGSTYDIVGSWGYVWSSSRGFKNPNNAWRLYFGSGIAFMRYNSRCFGYSMRGVLNK